MSSMVRIGCLKSNSQLAAAAKEQTDDYASAS